jgi:beta-glucanase (GH16 family)
MNAVSQAPPTALSNKDNRFMSPKLLGLLTGALIAGCFGPDILGAAEPARGQAAPSLPGEQLVPSRLPPGKQWKLVWSDEFNGTELDRTKWDFRLHMMHRRHKTWTDDAASLDGKGNLLLKVYEKDGDYYTSQLQTGSNYMDRPPDGQYTKQFTWPIAKIAPARFMHKYGYYEIRCKLPTQPGWWAAFWLQSPTIGSTLDPGVSGVEIDIMENFTRDGVISHNIHWNGYGKDHRGKGSGPIRRPELAEGFHTFGLYWSPKEYVFYTDGEVTWRVEGPISHREQFLLVSTECNGYRQGGPAPELRKAKLPDYFVVDYVRVFDEVEPGAPAAGKPR